MSRRPIQEISLELNLCLKLDYPPGKRAVHLPELARVDDVRRGRCRSKVRQIQYVECVERVATELDVSAFADERQFPKRKVLRQREVDIGIARTAEDVAATASRTQRGYVELRFRIREYAVDELLLRGVLNDAAKVSERVIRTEAVTVAVCRSIAAADRCRERITSVVRSDSADLPAAQQSSQRIMPASEDRQVFPWRT